ncbi:AAA family ATPase [Pseudomonas sp. PDM21]|uniref:AAA family ATPase n=1 Tax=Pseudomonas sp. PDM21 TaxID=2769257 RepID=UPI00177EB71D|nr:AAA family ATPase [Pseudomonas sp. PDM21]MBD9674940.1 AAA family ATPase [Pseudomonas sp. PDM21]
MAQKIILVAGQKGGGGKTTMAYGLAYALAQRPRSRVLLCDMDRPQYSTALLNELRKMNYPDSPPLFRVEKVARLNELGPLAEGYTHVVMDGAPHASEETLRMAEASTLVVIPTRPSILDLQPQVRLAMDLVHRGIDKRRIVFAVLQYGSQSDLTAARQTIEAEGFKVAGGLPYQLGYSRSNDKGLAIQETPFPTLRAQAEQLFEELAK